MTGFLIFDGSLHAKPKGQKMGGLCHHSSNTEQKDVAGHCLFIGRYVLLGQCCQLQPKLDCQKDIGEQEDRPFQSKVEMAVQAIGTFEPVPDTQTHVMMDSGCDCKQVRRVAQKRGWQVSGALKSNRTMHLIAEAGCPLLVTWIRKLGPTLLLITCHDLKAPLKTVRYWGGTVLDFDAQTWVDILAVGWEVETFFEYEKDRLGSDHDQGLTRPAILRFWTLTACLLSCLAEHRTQLADPTLTCGDVRRKIRNDHRHHFAALA